MLGITFVDTAEFEKQAKEDKKHKKKEKKKEKKKKKVRDWLLVLLQAPCMHRRKSTRQHNPAPHHKVRKVITHNIMLIKAHSHRQGLHRGCTTRCTTRGHLASPRSRRLAHRWRV